MLANRDSVIFDLDGTLWDSCAACAAGWNNVLRRHAIPFREITADDLRSVVGKSHEGCIRTVFEGLPEAQIRILIDETSEEDNIMVARMGGELFPGVAEGLQTLASRFPLFIVSNCQKGYIETFLRFTGFAPLFQDFECWGNTGLTKGENLRRVIERNGLRAPIYVGDAEGDEKAARECEVPFVWASYGFGRCSAPHATARSFANIAESFWEQ
jgi:phosphoglycolate phosphatase